MITIVIIDYFLKKWYTFVLSPSPSNDSSLNNWSLFLTCLPWLTEYSFLGLLRGFALAEYSFLIGPNLRKLRTHWKIECWTEVLGMCSSSWNINLNRYQVGLPSIAYTMISGILIRVDIFSEDQTHLAFLWLQFAQQWSFFHVFSVHHRYWSQAFASA